jgi:hypothetical protein
VTGGRLSVGMRSNSRSAFVFLAERAAPTLRVKALGRRMHHGLVTSAHQREIQIRRAVGVVLGCVLRATQRRAQQDTNRVATEPGRSQ